MICCCSKKKNQIVWLFRHRQRSSIFFFRFHFRCQCHLAVLCVCVACLLDYICSYNNHILFNFAVCFFASKTDSKNSCTAKVRPFFCAALLFVKHSINYFRIITIIILRSWNRYIIAKKKK